MNKLYLILAAVWCVSRSAPVMNIEDIKAAFGGAAKEYGSVVGVALIVQAEAEHAIDTAPAAGGGLKDKDSAELTELNDDGEVDDGEDDDGEDDDGEDIDEEIDEADGDTPNKSTGTSAVVGVVTIEQNSKNEEEVEDDAVAAVASPVIENQAVGGAVRDGEAVSGAIKKDEAVEEAIKYKETTVGDAVVNRKEAVEGEVNESAAVEDAVTENEESEQKVESNEDVENQGVDEDAVNQDEAGELGNGEAKGEAVEDVFNIR